MDEQKKVKYQGLYQNTGNVPAPEDLGINETLVDVKKGRVFTKNEANEVVAISGGQDASVSEYGAVTLSDVVTEKQLTELDTKLDLGLAEGLPILDLDVSVKVAELPKTRFNAYAFIFKGTDGNLYGTGRHLWGSMGLGNDINENVVGIQRLPFPNKPIKEWHTNEFTTYVLFEDFELWGCGRNDHGQLGLGDTTHRYTPTLLMTEVDGLIINRVGDYSTDNTQMIIRKAGRLLGAGHGGHGKLCYVGDNYNGNTTTWTELNMDYDKYPLVDCDIHSHGANIGAVWVLNRVTGDICVAGFNSYGALGLGFTGDSRTAFAEPAEFLEPGEKAIDVSCILGYTSSSSYSHARTWILTDKGNVYRTGNGGWGAWPGEAEVNVFTKVENLPKIVEFRSVGGSPSTQIAIDEQGLVWMWGYAEGGCVMRPDGETVKDPLPTIQQITNYKKSWNSDSWRYNYYPTWHVMVANDDGSQSLYSWGNNRYGAAGVGDATNPAQYRLCSGIPNHDDIVDISYSEVENSITTFILYKDGSLYACGYSGYGIMLGHYNVVDNQANPHAVRLL